MKIFRVTEKGIRLSEMEQGNWKYRKKISKNKNFYHLPGFLVARNWITHFVGVQPKENGKINFLTFAEIEQLNEIRTFYRRREGKVSVLMNRNVFETGTQEKEIKIWWIKRQVIATRGNRWNPSGWQTFKNNRSMQKKTSTSFQPVRIFIDSELQSERTNNKYLFNAM